MRWLVPTVNSDAVSRLTRKLKIPALIARLLVLRGVEEPEAAEKFLHPSLGHLHDPFLMADMGAAVQRLRQALERKEKILIYGDYDVDGTMAVVVLLTALRSLGACVETHIPHRLTDGYGMRVPPIEQAAAEGYTVVLSVDTGIRDHHVIARARELQLDCIVTDHHLPESLLPPACAILNPRRADCVYPEKNLSGVGVAFKLAQALLAGGGSERLVRSYLKIVAIGTIADVVPLTGENRVITRFGLEGLRRPVHPGLEALVAAAGLDAGRPITAGDVAFRLAPRLNAAGRMQSALEVIELLTTSDSAEAQKIAEQLEKLNRQRQEVEDKILREIIGTIEQDPSLSERYSLVFSGEGWHRGVIGIVAQRLVDRYHRPSLVIGVEHGIGQGSGRSIPRLHLLNALTRCSDLLERFGGHAQAAGFTLAAEHMGELERRLETYCRSVLKPQDLEPVLRVDAELSPGEINEELFRGLARLEPYGFGNPAPVFIARGLRVLDPPRILKEKHLKVRVGRAGKSFEAVAWRKAGEAERMRPGQTIDLAFNLTENVFHEKVTLQLVLKDMHF